MKTPRGRFRESLTIEPADVDETPLTIKQPVGTLFEGTSAFQIYNEAGDLIHEVDYLGEITIITDGAAMFAERLTGSGYANIEPGNISVGATDDTADPPLGVSFTGLGQVFRVHKSGSVVIAAHSALDDVILNQGDVSLWFDQTNGAAKLKVKAKTADGTVVTGQLALA